MGSKGSSSLVAGKHSRTVSVRSRQIYQADVEGRERGEGTLVCGAESKALTVRLVPGDWRPG